MVPPTIPLPQTILLLYDSTGNLLHVTSTHPPDTREGVFGLPAWHALNDKDALVCQGAILRCSATGQPQTFESDVPSLGRWRTTLHACRVGKVRLIGMARKVPESVTALTDRQRQICSMLASGMSSVQIGKSLDRARETIDNHRAQIAKRIGIEPWSLVAWCGENREWF